MRTPATAARSALRRSRLASSGVLVAAALALIGTATLIPASAPPTSDPTALRWCFRCGSFGTVDVILNVMLFVPLGAALRAGRARPLAAVAGMVLLSLSIEMVQLLWLRGRDPNGFDVIANGIGGVVGYRLMASVRAIAAPSPSVAGRRMAIGMLVSLAVRMAGAWLVVPSFPTTSWYGQVAAAGVYPADFDGEVIEARVAGAQLVTGRAPGLRERMLETGVRVVAIATPGERTTALAPIVSVLDDQRAEMLLLARDGDDARFRVRLRSADFRLRVPSIALPDAFAVGHIAPSSSLAITGSHERNRLRLTAGLRDSASVRLGAGTAWALLIPVDLGLSPGSRWLDLAWTLALFLPAAYWLGRASHPRPLLIGNAMLLAAVPMLAPFAVGLETMAPLGEWFAASAGVLTGVVAGRVTRRTIARTLAGRPGRAAGSST